MAINHMGESLEGRVKTLVRNIRIIRERKGYTQDYLAAKLEISQNAYSKIELGQISLTVERLFKIAMVLEMEAIELLNFRRSATEIEDEGKDIVVSE